MNGVYRLSTSAIAKITGTNVVMRSKFPKNSLLSNIVPESYFSDSFERYKCDIQNQSAIALYFKMHDLKIAKMAEPNKPIESYKVGDILKPFTITHNTPSEIALLMEEKHMDVRISLLKVPETNSVIVTSVVHVHSTLGKIKMNLIEPIHSILAPLILKNLKGLEVETSIV
jgi:hypothetical protein